MMPFATHIAAAAIAGVLAFGAAWQVQAWRYDALGIEVEWRIWNRY